MIRHEQDAWLACEGDKMVSCPDCAFTFDAFHTTPDGRYECPSCDYDDLIAALRLIVKAAGIGGGS